MLCIIRKNHSIRWEGRLTSLLSIKQEMPFLCLHTSIFKALRSLCFPSIRMKRSLQLPFPECRDNKSTCEYVHGGIFRCAHIPETDESLIEVCVWLNITCVTQHILYPLHLLTAAPAGVVTSGLIFSFDLLLIHSQCLPPRILLSLSLLLSLSYSPGNVNNTQEL